MPRPTVDDLAKCINDSDGSKAAIRKCEDRFVRDGGKGTAEGGKVFTDPDGGELYVTTGGKVFSPKA